MRVYIAGAGPGDPELLTIKARKVLERAEVVVYAGSLINPEVLEFAKEGAELHDSSGLTLEEVMAIISRAVGEGKTVVRLHSGDPSIYGAIAEQMELLESMGIDYEVIPGVSSIMAAAASLRREYTLPGISQSLIVTRLGGRTEVPEAESLAELANHGCSMAIFLSAHLIEEAVAELRKGYAASTPAAVVYRASWEDEEIVEGSLGDIAEKARAVGIKRNALILVGDFLRTKGKRSRLYAADFDHGYRRKKSEKH